MRCCHPLSRAGQELQAKAAVLFGKDLLQGAWHKWFAYWSADMPHTCIRARSLDDLRKHTRMAPIILGDRRCYLKLGCPIVLLLSN
jgi:hypothetical protein